MHCKVENRTRKIFALVSEIHELSSKTPARDMSKVPSTWRSFSLNAKHCVWNKLKAEKNSIYKWGCANFKTERIYGWLSCQPFPLCSSWTNFTQKPLSSVSYNTLQCHFNALYPYGIIPLVCPLFCRVLYASITGCI